MSEEVNWSEIVGLLEKIYASTERLEEIFPGRKFTLDGHLVGSVGEVVAAYMFDLDLNRASTKAHDAVTKVDASTDAKNVEIKFTQGSGVAIRHKPDHLLVLHRPRQGGVCVVYNGPGHEPWEEAGEMASNGQKAISLRKLEKLYNSVPASKRLLCVRDAPI